jgi:hypothetical protein
MRELLKLGLTVLALLVLAGCGGGGGSSQGGGDNGGSGNDDIADFMSEFPPFDTAGYTVTHEYKDVLYYDDSSSALALAFNATMSGKDVTPDYDSNSYYNDDNDFAYYYELNDPVPKGLNYGYVMIEGRIDSYIGIQLEADKSISNDKFANLFGEIDASLLGGVCTDTAYNGNMSAEFAAYYADVTGSGGLFDAAVDCGYTDHVTHWECHKYDGEFTYEFWFDFDGTTSQVTFQKSLF